MAGGCFGGLPPFSLPRLLVVVGVTENSRGIGCPACLPLKKRADAGYMYMSRQVAWLPHPPGAAFQPIID